jgi:hypothetical protein
MHSLTNTEWFVRASHIVRAMVEENGGAILRTRTELKEAIKASSEDMAECPDQVLQHLNPALVRRASLTCCAYENNDGELLIIFDAELSEASARQIIKDVGLTNDVAEYRSRARMLVNA